MRINDKRLLSWPFSFSIASGWIEFFGVTEINNKTVFVSFWCAMCIDSLLVE